VGRWLAGRLLHAIASGMAAVEPIVEGLMGVAGACWVSVTVDAFKPTWRRDPRLVLRCESGLAHAACRAALSRVRPQTPPCRTTRIRLKPWGRWAIATWTNPCVSGPVCVRAPRNDEPGDEAFQWMEGGRESIRGITRNP